MGKQLVRFIFVALLNSAVVALGFVGCDDATDEISTDETPSDVSPEQACLDAGGSVGTSLCCGSVGDFPNTCLIGGCGCAPEYSSEVKVCDCPENTCFDGEKCVDFEY